MTANSVLEQALALVLSDPKIDTDYARHAVPIINLLMCETAEINNSLRLFKGLAPLAEVPLITSLGDEVPYEHELVMGGILYGICAKLLVDDDIQKAVYFQNLYVNGACACDKCVSGDVRDAYGERE